MIKPITFLGSIEEESYLREAWLWERERERRVIGDLGLKGKKIIMKKKKISSAQIFYFFWKLAPKILKARLYFIFTNGDENYNVTNETYFITNET